MCSLESVHHFIFYVVLKVAVKDIEFDRNTAVVHGHNDTNSVCVYMGLS